MGRSLEEMDIIFGAVTAEERQRYIEAEAKGTLLIRGLRLVCLTVVRFEAAHCW